VGCEPEPVDVLIHPGAVPSELQAPLVTGVLFQADADRFLLTVDPLVRFLAIAGREVIVDLLAPHSQAEAVIFLTGPVMGALLRQRGRLALHGSAVVTPNGALFFVGDSACGKSTLAAALQQRGWPVLSDEICALSFLPGGVIAFPGCAQLPLWSDALGKLGIDPQPLSRMRPGIERYLLPPLTWLSDPVPVRMIYELSVHNQPRLDVTELSRPDEFNLLKRHTYLRRLISQRDAQAAHFHLVSQVVQAVPIRRIIRPAYPFLLQELADLVVQEPG
jgi:hypothetical protein